MKHQSQSFTPRERLWSRDARRVLSGGGRWDCWYLTDKLISDFGFISRHFIGWRAWWAASLQSQKARSTVTSTDGEAVVLITSVPLRLRDDDRRSRGGWGWGGQWGTAVLGPLGLGICNPAKDIWPYFRKGIYVCSVFASPLHPPYTVNVYIWIDEFALARVSLILMQLKAAMHQKQLWENSGRQANVIHLRRGRLLQVTAYNRVRYRPADDRRALIRTDLVSPRWTSAVTLAPISLKNRCRGSSARCCVA